jgi:hypothetical protein
MKAKLKEAELRRKKEEAALFQTAIVQPKVPFGVDPKTIMCAFFKAGICEKGTYMFLMSHIREILGSLLTVVCAQVTNVNSRMTRTWSERPRRRTSTRISVKAARRTRRLRVSSAV